MSIVSIIELVFRTSLLICACLLVGCGSRYDVVEYRYDSSKSELENLQGEWVCVQVTRSGNVKTDCGKRCLQFQNDTVIMRRNAHSKSGVVTSFRLDSDGLGKSLICNFALHGSQFQNVAIDLYRFHDGALEICSTSRLNDRPKQFSSTIENGYRIERFLRVRR